MASLRKNPMVAGFLYILGGLFGIVRLIYIPAPFCRTAKSRRRRRRLSLKNRRAGCREGCDGSD